MSSFDGDWTGYAPLGGPPPGTQCCFCETAFPGTSSRGWVIAESSAVCGLCLKRLAKASAAGEGLSVEDWARSP